MRYPDYLVHYNKNHDKRTGRFTFGDGNGDGVSPDNYRTPELDKKYDELKKTGVLNLYDNKPWLNPEDNIEEKWGKDVAKAVDIGIKAFGAEKMWGSEDIDKNSIRSWFLLEDQAIGFPEIAYLVVKGWSGDKIFNALRDANKMWEKTNEFRNDYTGYPNEGWLKKSIGIAEKDPYKNVYTLMEASRHITDESDTVDTYIAECEKLLKEMEHSDMDYSSMDYSEYLMHFNKNHDKKSGRFTYGDGDGDSIRDDHSNQSKKQSISDGSKKTIVVTSPKNPRNPFSGSKKTKIEVSDDVYKEVMKSDTVHSIRRGTGNLINSGLFIAAGVLTENPVVLGIGVGYLVGSAADYVNSGTHFVNKIIDSAYKNKPIEELDTLVKIDPSFFNKKYYDTNSKEIRKLSMKDARKEVLDRTKKS